MPRKNAQNQEVSQEVVEEVAQAIVAEIVADATPATVEVAPVSKRGRKATNTLTVAKFNAAVKSGIPLPGMTYHAQEFHTPPTPPTWAGYTATVLEPVEDGLAIVSLGTEGRSQRPVVISRRVVSFEEVLAALVVAETPAPTTE